MSKVKEYPCHLSDTKQCKHGGNKHYNYGFLSGTSLYCRKIKRWILSLDKCPTTEEK